MRKLACILVLTLAAGAGAAYAAPPLGITRNIAGTGLQQWAVRRIIAAADTTDAVTARSSTSAAACFAWGTVVSVSVNAETTVCWAMTSTLSIGGQTTVNATTISGSSSATGPGACYTLQAGEVRDFVPDWRTLSRTPGARTGLCSAATAWDLNSGQGPFPPCRADGDCVEAGCGAASTCNLSPAVVDLRNKSCAFIAYASAGTTVDLTVSVER